MTTTEQSPTQGSTGPNTNSVLAQIAALKTAPTADLKRRGRELYGREAPPFSRPYLETRLAFRIQELAFGGLRPETVARLDAIGEQLDGGNVALRRLRTDDWPIAGTRLVRQYHGTEHVVT